MSLGDNDKKPAWRIDTKAITRYLEKSHRVYWTIETVSKLRDSVEIKGPDVYINGYKFELLSRKNGNELFINFYNRSGLLKIDYSLVLLDCGGTKLLEMIRQNEVFNYNSYFSIKWQLHSLKDDKLIIDCSLKWIGHDTKKLGPFQTQEEYQKKLLLDLKMIYNNPDGSDFTLQVGDDLIHAHKTILSLRSAYFKRMFQTDMTEKVQNSVLITDVSYSTMKKLVEFLYTGNFTMAEADNFVQEVRNLYVAADKYQVIDLRSLCADELVSKSTDINILENLQLAVSYNDEHFKTEAMKLVLFHFDKILNSNTWKTFLLNDVDLASEILNFCFKKT